MGAETRDDALREARMRLLDKVEETRDEHGAYHPTRLLNEAPDNETQAVTLDGLNDLSRAGLLVERDEASLAEDRWTISPTGRTALHERARLRSDVRARNEQCRRAVIEWLYAVKHDDSPLDEGNWRRFGEIEGNVWFGRPFSEKALDNASRSLYDEGLIKGVSSAGHDRIERPEITSRGQAWLDRQAAPPAVAQGGGAIWHIAGNAYVNSVDNSPGSTNTQSMSVTVSHDERQLLLQRLDAVDQALSLAPLEGDAQDQALDAARAVRAEVEAAAPDRGRIAAAFQRLAEGAATGFGSSAGSALLTGTVAGLGQAWQAVQ